MKRFLLIGLILALAIGSLYWFLADNSPFHSLKSYVENGDVLTLETRYSADELMEEHRRELIGNSSRTYQEPQLYFHPYVLMDVKYFDKNHKTKQGTILWGLMDGEMVLNTDPWNTTNGFEDAINANATPQEFRLLNALADHKGSLTREKLQKQLNLEQDPLTALIDSSKQKQLIVVKGNDVSLHFEDPLFNVLPQTKLASQLVIKPYHQGKKLSPKYSSSKIERIAKAAFGSEFTIRSLKEVYLPVFRISVLNPDGSLLITDWNALTGNRLNTQPS